MISHTHIIDFGINKFNSPSVFESADGQTRFILKGNKNAKSIKLVADFLPKSKSEMVKKNNEWEIYVPVKSGKNLYKFNIDGKDALDKCNELKEDHPDFGQASVYYKPNYIFELSDHMGATTVFVAGNFNGWQLGSLELQVENDCWQLPVFLPDGTYAYKFIVDGHWITDPQNPILRPDGSGNYNSYISIGDISVFKLYGHLDVHEAKLAGNFNMWNYTELAMARTPSGWELHLALQPGVYEYKFIVDDEWITDPNNPYHFYRNQGRNSLVSIKPNQLFKLKNHESAKEVVLTGTFNDWNRHNYKMVRENVYWIFPLYLPQGVHLYNFIVDGELIEDPDNSTSEKNEFGSTASVLKL